MNILRRLFRSFSGPKSDESNDLEDNRRQDAAFYENDDSWPESRLREFQEMIDSDPLSLHEFPFREFIQDQERNDNRHPNWMTSGGVGNLTSPVLNKWTQTIRRLPSPILRTHFSSDLDNVEPRPGAGRD